MNKKLQIFKKYSKDKKFYNLPTCHDPLTAKLIEKKGFKISSLNFSELKIAPPIVLP